MATNPQSKDLSSANKSTIGEVFNTSRNVEQPYWSLPLHVVVTLQSWVRGCRQRSRWPAQSRSLANVIKFRAAQRASSCIKTSFPGLRLLKFAMLPAIVITTNICECQLAGFVAKIYHFHDGPSDLLFQFHFVSMCCKSCLDDYRR